MAFVSIICDTVITRECLCLSFSTGQMELTVSTLNLKLFEQKLWEFSKSVHSMLLQQDRCISCVYIKLSTFACLASSTTEQSYPLPPKHQSVQLLVYWRQPGYSFIFCMANGQTLSHLERGGASGLFKQVAAGPIEHTLLTFLTMLRILLSTTSFQRSCSGPHFTQNHSIFLTFIHSAPKWSLDRLFEKSNILCIGYNSPLLTADNKLKHLCAVFCFSGPSGVCSHACVVHFTCCPGSFEQT